MRDRLLDRLHELYPETAQRRIVGERVLRRNDCPRFAPGDFAAPADRRHTARPAVMLAGDGIRIDLPVALMERAATTGWSAANRATGALRAWRATPCTRCRYRAARRRCGGLPTAKGESLR